MVKVHDMDPPEVEEEGADGEADASELNRLLPESGKEVETVVMMNHTPPEPAGDSSPSGSRGSRRNTESSSDNLQTTEFSAELERRRSSVNNQDVDKISNTPIDDEADNDTVDESTRLTNPVPEPEVVINQPKGAEYQKVMELLKEAERCADPEYEEKQRKLEFLMKYNPRNPESGLGVVDYLCNAFQCCALCIEG